MMRMMMMIYIIRKRRNEFPFASISQSRNVENTERESGTGERMGTGDRIATENLSVSTTRKSEHKCLQLLL